MHIFKKTIFTLAVLACAATSLSACSSDDPIIDNPIEEQPTDEEPIDETPVEKEWVLDFEDNFDGPELDTEVWSRIPPGSPDWQNTQAPDDDRCFEFRDGTLVLRGILHDRDGRTDAQRFHTGGIWSKGKKAFAPGKFEVCVRMKNCRGAWPAIWLMPFASADGWPACGEIDIMETLNYDKFTYQTIHSKYADTDGQKSNPKHSGTSPFNYEDWNVFGVEMYEDKLVFTINGEATFTYPRLEPAVDGQYPFYQPQELRIDQQLGGSWVGPVNATTLPAEMEVDWVKHYVLEPKKQPTEP